MGMRAVVNIRFSVDWRATAHRIVHFIRHYTKEIIVALVLAIVAAIVIDRYEKRKQLETTLDNLKAVATLVVSDKDGHVTSQGSGFFVTHDGVLATNYHVVKGGVEVIAKLPSGAFYMMRGVRDIDEPDDIAILQFDPMRPLLLAELVIQTTFTSVSQSTL
jgi:S1-C subfamily serine protease